MACISWSPLFNVGVEVFDREHREIVELINRHDDAQREGRGLQSAFETLNALVRYAEGHFAHERDAMERHNYPDRLRHRREHDRLLEEAFELNRRLTAGAEPVEGDIAEFLKSWLLQHILDTDRKYGTFFEGKPIS